jgi:hypothetical protein
MTNELIPGEPNGQAASLPEWDEEQVNEPVVR